MSQFTMLAEYSAELRALLREARGYIPGDNELHGRIHDILTEYPDGPVFYMSATSMHGGWLILHRAEDALDEMLSRESADGESWIEGFDYEKALAEIKALTYGKKWTSEYGTIYWITMTDLEVYSLPEYDR